MIRKLSLVTLLALVPTVALLAGCQSSSAKPYGLKGTNGSQSVVVGTEKGHTVVRNSAGQLSAE